MSELQQEYYIPFVRNTENKLFINTDEKSSRRYYHYRKFNIVDGPMVYLNDYKEENLKLGINTPLPDIFLDFGLFPTIYIDDNDQWHENLWLVNFFEGIDCIDKQKSKINYDPRVWDEGDRLIVKKTIFDDSVLRAIPEDQRLIFKMANVDKPHLYCHKRVVDYIREQNYTGVIFVKASDYKRGMENQPGWTGE